VTTVSIIGVGKMGLPLAVWMASRGASVWACDINPSVVSAIEAGNPNIDEPGVHELLHDALAAGRLRATTDTAAAVSESDVVIVIAPAILTSAYEADLSNLRSASRDIARGLRPGTLVIYETTVPVGTTREQLLPILETSGVSLGDGLSVAYSPERVKSRLVMRHLQETPKIVGGFDEASGTRAAEFYRESLGAPVIDVGTPEAAEFVKLAGMIYRDVNIALANQLSSYAEAAGLDTVDLFDAANTDGECALLAPGIGVGGHCTPIYPYFLIQDAKRRDVDASIVATARQVNDSQPERMTLRLEQHLGSLAGVRVGILGFGFRPEVKEHICSPTFLLEAALRSHGADVRVHDPLYGDDELADHGFTTWAPDSADWRPEAVVLATGHASYRDLDLAGLGAAGLRVVVDGRRFWDPDTVSALGLHYIGTGRADTPTTPDASLRRRGEPLRLVRVMQRGAA
jgi:nucleotide sugar dehydrogenase